MRVFKSKVFARWADGEGVSDDVLLETIQKMDDGHRVANLGGNVYKPRVAAIGGGKSAGFRTLVVYKMKSRAFFAYGFSKGQRANISDKELKAFKKLSKEMLGMPAQELNAAINDGAQIELKVENK